MLYKTSKLLILLLLGILLVKCKPSQLVGYSQFIKMPSSQTGIQFNNLIADQIDHNIFIYSNYYGGAGVGVGDFNKDGLQDIYFAGNLVPDKLYINKGAFKFDDISNSAGIIDDGGWSTSVVVLDINQDGWDDIYVTRELYDDQPSLRSNLLYINNTDLTFDEKASEYGLDDTGRTRHATFFDYDRDGDLDAYLMNQPPNPGNFSAFKDADLKKPEYTSKFLENQNGKFIDITTESGLFNVGFPNSAITGDFNSDGWTDLYVAHDFDAPDKYYLNNGDGTFTNVIDSAMSHISFYSMGVDAADINNDQLLDIMVLDMSAEDNFRLKANMSGMDPNTFWDVYNSGGHRQYMYNSLQLNRGKNAYSDIAHMSGMSSTDWSWSNLIYDLDNDGLKDVFITNGLLRDIRNTDSEKEVTKYINKVFLEHIQKNPNNQDVNVWDLVDLDLALSKVPSEKLTNYTYKNNGDLTFSKVSETWGLGDKSFSNGSAVADLDNNGFPDLIVSNINDEAFIYKNMGPQATETHYLRIVLNDPRSKTILGSKVIIQSAGGTQMVELSRVRGMYSSSENIVHFGLGNDVRVDTVRVIWPDQTITELADIKANQLLEIDKPIEKTRIATETKHKTMLSDVSSQVNLDFKHQENIFDDYRYQVLLPHKQSQFGPALAKGDVNGDGLEDIFIGGASGQGGVLFLQTTDAYFQKSTSQPWQKQSLQEDMDAIFFDFDNDSDLDLYVVSGGNEFEESSIFYEDRLYVNEGNGQFSLGSNVLPKLFHSGSKVLPFDLDNDGDEDLFIGSRLKPRSYPEPVSSVILINEDGQFKEQAPTLTRHFQNLGMVTDAYATDINQDGWTDLIVTGEWMPITVFMNSNGTLAPSNESMGLEMTNGWWYSINGADFDGDGDEDFIVGNLGLNYKYHASTEEPFEVYYEDFDGNGNKDIVLSYYNFGEKFPLRGRSCSAQQVPSLKEKFPTYEGFAISGLEEVYEISALENSLNYQAFTFESVYLENLNGSFKITTLPKEAQMSSINCTTILDLDDDSNLDVILAGNLYTSEIETPRNDASLGLVLMGNGKGEFDPVAPVKSGLYASKDVKKMVQVNGEKSNLIIMAANDDFPMVYKPNTTE